MKLMILSQVRHCDGLIDLDIRIDQGKVYSFTLASDYDLQTILKIKRRQPGRAFNFLKKHNHYIKGENQ